MSKQDDADAAFYDNPENLRTHGPVHRRAGHPRLSSHTPVRFDADTVAAIRLFSDEDGVTVSAWVRRVVGREIRRRLSLRSQTGSAQMGRTEIHVEQNAAVTTTSTRVLMITDLRAA